MCSKDQVMNIPFLLLFYQKQLPASVPHVWAVCWKAVWTESVQPWATFLHPTGTGPAPGPALAHQTPRWGRKWYQRCFFTTYLLLFVRYCLGTVTAMLHTPNQNPGALGEFFLQYLHSSPRTVRHNFSPLYPQPLSSLSLWSSSSGPLHLPLPDLSSLPASLPPLIWSCFSLLKSPSWFTHTYKNKFTFFLTARVLFYNLAVPLSSLTLAAASKLPQSWHMFQTKAASWNIPPSFVLSCLPTGYNLCPESPFSSLAIWKLCFAF